jgi:hypothetical protein
MARTGRNTAVLIALAIVSVAMGCSRAPPEQQLRAALNSLQTSVEEHDISSLEDGLAADFVGPNGLDREGARRLARLTFLRHRDIGVQMGPPQIELQDRHATVKFSAALTGGAGGLLPDAVSVYDVDTAWRMEEGEWRLISASWTPRL